MATSFNEPKRKSFPWRPRSPALVALTQTCAFILTVNWCLQGMRGMDRKELTFRLGLELLVAAALVPMLAWMLPSGMACVAALLAAHSVSFTLNGQFWVCARYCRCYGRDPRLLDGFLQQAAATVCRQPWLREAVCIGSLGRTGTAHGDRADLDVRLLFPPGLRGWLRTNLLLLRLRAHAFVAGIPLDLYAYERPERLRRFDQREPLLVLLDRDGRLARLYPRRVTPWP